MAALLVRDPNLDICPDFDSEPFEPMRELMRNTGLTDEQAIDALREAWTTRNDQLRERWAHEAEARRARAEAEAQQPQDQVQQPPPPPPANIQPEGEEIGAGEERTDRERRGKPKLRSFDPNLSVASVLVPRPSSYALNKLANFEYCELWYFTQEGCEDAQRSQRAEADDAFGMARVGEMVMLRPVASVQASKRVVQDADLTWEQFHYAQRSFVNYVLKADWPEEHAQALVWFFVHLENSAYINRENGKKILLSYQARVRRNWMDVMKQSDGPAFNIAIINNELMETISRELQSITTSDLHRQHGTLARFLERAQDRTAFLPVRYASAVIVTKSASAPPKPCGTEHRQGASETSGVAWSTQTGLSSAPTGNVPKDAAAPVGTTYTSAPGAGEKLTALKCVLEHRSCEALSPYKHDAWEHLLTVHKLLPRYPSLPYNLRTGFDAGIPPINVTNTPNNSPSLHAHSDAYLEIIEKEFRSQRYVGPLSQAEVEALIGPFQTSPLSLVPKPGKPNKFRAVHNFSFPRAASAGFLSINHHIDSDLFPCTWGTFPTICATIWNLPPDSQASVRDVAEAYRSIPIMPKQWPGLVVKLRGEDNFAINTTPPNVPRVPDIFPA
ncbi:hypothetical protein D9615_007475 [Tricholomella constricta]|uniref:Uncharacterized protein n=1 Tax=Tricholomella constricta TaxID=117010 RepID=A0A8H5GY18_9AGAR|nr:hypothetical protein D9615_007475 [Tricholomella constricta]